jgi:ribonuclease P protein component
VVYSYRADPPATRELDTIAVGVVASRKVGNAVARSRAKRRLREAYRSLRPRIRGPLHVVLVARRALAARSLPLEPLMREMESLLQELGALSPSDPSTRGDLPSC